MRTRDSSDDSSSEWNERPPLRRSDSFISAESCSKWCPESPRRIQRGRLRVLDLSDWGRSPSKNLHHNSDSRIKDPHHGQVGRERIEEDSLLASTSSPIITPSNRLDERPLSVAVRATPKELLEPTLNYPPPHHGLDVEPTPIVTHPNEWDHEDQNVFIRQIKSAHGTDESSPVLLAEQVPFSTSVPIDNALFEGIAMIRIRGLNEEKDTPYFQGKRRRHQLVVQGKFKQRYRADEIWGGQIFRHSWVNMPSTWLMKAALNAAKMVNPSMLERIQSDKNPFVLFPWISMPQKVNICRKNETPPDIYNPAGITEDCTLLGSQFLGKDNFFRRKYFTDYSKLQSVYFEKDMIYTFEDYQDALDFNTFDFNIKLSSLDISYRLHDMPLEMGVMRFKPTELKNKRLVEDEFEDSSSVPYFWRFQLWPKPCVINRFYSSAGQTKRR